VAYLWARTVKCKNCRAIVPLLKTRWLCKKDRKRVLLTLDIATEGTENTKKSNAENISVNSVAKKVVFGIQNDVPAHGGNAAQKREHDKRIGEGTMSRAGAKCPCCSTIMTMEDIRLEGKAERINDILTSVVIDTSPGKAFRLPTNDEVQLLQKAKMAIDELFESLPFGKINEPIDPASTRSISCDIYGINNFNKAFNSRQQVAIGTFVKVTRSVRKRMNGFFYNSEWEDAIFEYLALSIDRIVDRCSVFCRWDIGRLTINNTYSRFALSMLWDYCESNPISTVTGSYDGAVEWVAQVIDHCIFAQKGSPKSNVLMASASDKNENVRNQMDLIITDPPYYQAISYADLSDLFYIWQKRIHNSEAFSMKLTSKEKEVVQHIRKDKDKTEEKEKYEKQMYESFVCANKLLNNEGRFVVVFAHKDPYAWETLVNAIIRAGFVVTASWPIATEMSNRGRAQSAAALASSVWLVCKKRPITTRPGWDNKVLEEVRANVTDRLRDYWDAGIRGPDFVWAATGPALEAYSKHPIVKKANTPGEVMSVGEFLSHVRRMVVDFVVGQVLTGEKEGSDMAAADRMDAPTAYYLLHRHDFGIDGAPAGACILYAMACGLSDRDLESAWDLVSHKGSAAKKQDEDEAPDPDAEAEPEGNGGSGSKIKLKTWAQRKRRTMGYEAPSGRPIPLIDRVHCLMHLWRAGDVHKVDEYLDDNGLRRQELFKRLVQSLIELSNGGSEERSLLESLSNHVQAKGATVSDSQKKLTFGDGNIAD
jgi:adenine-specific DNA methylase